MLVDHACGFQKKPRLIHLHIPEPEPIRPPALSCRGEIEPSHRDPDELCPSPEKGLNLCAKKESHHREGGAQPFPLHCPNQIKP